LRVRSGIVALAIWVPLTEMSKVAFPTLRVRTEGLGTRTVPLELALKGRVPFWRKKDSIVRPLKPFRPGRGC
jgi:hypothetical protein